MKPMKLTTACADAVPDLNKGWGRAMKSGVRSAMIGAAVVAASALSGCINVAAPDEPIVIELNITIRQEVLLLLADDAQNTIEENEDIF